LASCIFLAVLLLFPGNATAEPTQEPVAETPDSSFRLLIQVGIWYRITDQPSVDPSDHRMLLTWDLGGYRWDGRSRTWGLTVRGAADNFGFRVGPKAFLRFPLGSSGSSFFQLGATYYLFAVAGDLSERPGWGGEVEVAPLPNVSFALGVEVLKTGEYTYDSAHEFPYWTDDVSSTNWYAGAKMDSWLGIALTAALFGVVAAAYAGG